MTRDLLGEATRALRERGGSPPEGAGRPLDTRARVLSTLRGRRTRRLTFLRRVLPLAAVLVTSSAWAASQGRLSGSFDRIASVFGAGPEDPVVPTKVVVETGTFVASAPEPSAEPVVEEVVEERRAIDDGARDAAPFEANAPRVVAEKIASVPSSAGSSAKVAVTSSETKPSKAKASPNEAEDPVAHALYRAAHEAHFAAHDAAGALAAWDAYLKAAPRGRFAAEAHYNRALCLVRLGRIADARPALEAFASGGFGGYRRSEARSLLDALARP